MQKEKAFLLKPASSMPTVTGEMGHMTQSELETKTTGKFYILDHK